MSAAEPWPCGHFSTHASVSLTCCGLGEGTPTHLARQTTSSALHASRHFCRIDSVVEVDAGAETAADGVAAVALARTAMAPRTTTRNFIMFIVVWDWKN